MILRKLTRTIAITACILSLFLFFGHTDIYAAEADLIFGSDSYENESGAEFPIGVYIDGDENIGYYRIEIEYDKERMEYLGGGTGDEDGKVIFEGRGSDSRVSAMLSFKAISGGNTTIKFGEASVRTDDGNGEEFTINEKAEVPVILLGEDLVEKRKQETETKTQTETQESTSAEETVTESTKQQPESKEEGVKPGIIIGVLAAAAGGAAAIAAAIAAKNKKARRKAAQERAKTTVIQGKQPVKPAQETMLSAETPEKQAATVKPAQVKPSKTTLVKDNSTETIPVSKTPAQKKQVTTAEEKITRVKPAQEKITQATPVREKITPAAPEQEKTAQAAPVPAQETRAKQILQPDVFLRDKDSDKPVIEVKNVSMSFKSAGKNVSGVKDYLIQKAKGKNKKKNINALRNISFNIYKGEVVGIIGTNGSGKSTLLKIVSGALKPTSGEVTADKNKIQLLTLGTGFDAELSAKENVYLNGAIIGYSKEFIDKHYDEIVEFAELQNFMGEKVKNFSSGMVSRLGFSIATAAGAAEILILDEVLSVGDQFFRKKSMKRIKDMIHGGSTVIMVSHSLNAIKTDCDRVIWIEKGILRMIGTPEEVCGAYAASHPET